MSLVPSFLDVLQRLAVVMTLPTFDSFRLILSGWVFAPRRTITGMLLAAGALGRKHHSAFHRVFSAARWSLDRLGLAVFDLLVPWLGERVFLAVDDTLARKRGLKVFGVGMHLDPIISSRGRKLVNWGHSWVVLGVLLRFPLWPERWFCLPVLFRLYLNQSAAARHRRVYRTRPELAIEMLQLLCKARNSRRFHLVADSAYGGQSVLAHLPENCDLTSRLLLTARLHALPPERRPGQNGRPRKRGLRQATPEEMLQTRCRQVRLAIYGRKDRIRLTDTLACVYAVPDRLLRIVATQPLSGGRTKQAFYSTANEATGEEILTWYAARWSLEVTFHEAKQHLGFEQPQNWSRRAVERTAPVALLLYSLIVLWFVREGHRHYRSPDRPWYTTHRHASFVEMLATLKTQSLKQQVLSVPLTRRERRKLMKTLETTVQSAV
jgi:hypothetical protein